MSTLVVDGAPAAGAGSSTEDVDASLSSAADATLRALRRGAAAPPPTRGARELRAGVHREEDNANDGDEASAAGLAVEEARSIVIGGRGSRKKKKRNPEVKCLELASYFFPFVEKANERRCFKMSSDDVPLGDPLSASALIDVRSRASPSLLHRKGKRRTGRESYERERERKTEASKVFLGNRAHAHPSPRPPSSSLPPSLDDHNNTRPPPPAPTTTPLPLLLPRRP